MENKKEYTMLPIPLFPPNLKLWKMKKIEWECDWKEFGEKVSAILKKMERDESS